MPYIALSIFLATAAVSAAAPTAPAPAAVEPEYLISLADGPLRIGPDGRVRDVDLRTSLVMSDEAALEAMVKRWTFAPVLENGRAVTVDARAELDLVAVVAADGTARVGIQSARFFEGRHAPTAADHGLRLAPPRWPKDALRSGALVMLRIGLDADAQADDIRIDGGWLTGQAAKPDGAKALKARRALLQAAKDAAVYWNFAAVADGDCVLRVPVRFWLPVEGWQPAAPVPAEPPMETPNCPLELGRDGEPTSQRVTLLTALRPPMPAAAAPASAPAPAPGAASAPDGAD